MAYTRFGSAPDTDTPIFPMSPFGIPGLRVRSVQWSPPSVLLKIPPPGPPASMLHDVRDAFQNVAYSTFGFDGSITRSSAPTESPLKRIFCQLFPPSFERKTPRSAFFPNG